MEEILGELEPEGLEATIVPLEAGKGDVEKVHEIVSEEVSADGGSRWT